MLCTRCRRFEAAPDGVVCAHCAAAGAPLMAPPHGHNAWLSSPVGLGRAVAALLGLVIATDLFAVWADVMSYDVLGALMDGEYSEAVQRRADRADSLYAAAGVAQTVALLATAVVFLVWFHRVRVNAEVFDPFGHRKKRGWAVGAWFVPFVNLWFPRRIAVDIWDASSPWDRGRPHGLLNGWWTAWVISLLAGRLASTSYRNAETAPEIRRAMGQVLFADVVDIVAAVLAILFVLALTRMQDEKARSGPGSAAPVSS
ncbi:DUF4328 domain-containing protein [Streptomyces caeruleatus]|uniref:DUF4328 domain-containing protein n=1 Tax=Streptomyces caeruleatus TaxID=661399 RepID=A0A101U296_9ACTN|nr:DUF4328 domain-containing protein [Streptomyces caeruleatus]KUO02640.1 hypothetical protein AQJ67_19435 [Streptomyces caeruleatus]